MHALVVDDSRTVRRILGEMLRQLGFEVAEAADGRQALLRLDEAVETPDIVLVDWNMPEMNGLELIKNVRSQLRFRNVPLMMVTTENEMEQVAKALEAGANEYVMKPFDKEAIADKLQLMGIVTS
jgi:two-component system chemotaxis response regulator CheY